MQAMLVKLSATLPPGLRGLASEARIAVTVQLAMFASVGVVGLLVDIAVVYSLRARLGLYGAGMASYCVAATVTWALNRAWTFRGLGSGPMHRQWALFLAANLIGFLLNRGTYVALVAFVPLCASVPAIAVSAGAVAGMFSNFVLSRRLVFR